MSYLQEFGIIDKSNRVESADVFEHLLPNIFSPELQNLTSSQFIEEGWKRYQAYPYRTVQMGKVIVKCLFASTLIREQLTPFFMQAKIAFVPNINYDISMFARDIGPVCFRIEPTLQKLSSPPALEALAIKKVHRQAKCYLISLERKNLVHERAQHLTGDTSWIDAIVSATTSDFDALINRLKGFTFEIPEPVEVITASRFITSEKVFSE